jgi:NADH dehydrogenase
LTAADTTGAHGVLITGANGHLGQRLIVTLCATRPVTALVRSSKAAAQLGQLAATLPAASAANLNVRQFDYSDINGITQASKQCNELVHLAGILMETPNSSYQQAHVETTTNMLKALAGRQLKRIHYLSIVGSHPDSLNPCLASKGVAEQLLLSSPHPTTVLQVPMVLGEGDYAATALCLQASRALNLVFAQQARDQPIYAGDVVTAIINGSRLPADYNRMIQLAGPESISKRDLIHRAATLLKHKTRVIGLPGFVALAVARALALLSNNPPITGPMLDILNHDDSYEVSTACQTLDLELTPLDDMLLLVLNAAGHAG